MQNVIFRFNDIGYDPLTVVLQETDAVDGRKNRYESGLRRNEDLRVVIGRKFLFGALGEHKGVAFRAQYPGSFLVFGNKPTLETTELCNVDYTELTLEEYITEAVEFLTEMTNGYDCTDIVTHRLNEFLSSNNTLSDDLFLDSVSMFTYGFLDYTLSLPVGESTVVVEQPMTVGLNSQFNPKVYVGKIYSPAQTAPLSFFVTTEQFVVDSTLTLKNNAYSGDAAESITIVFCEVQNPDLVNGAAPVRWEPWRIAVVSVCGVIGLASIVAFLVFVVPWKKIIRRKN